MGYIYKITNLKTDKVYVGQTAGTIEHRFEEHKKNARNGTPYYLYNAMRKYGEDNFIIQEIEECDNTSLNEREKYWITYYDSYNSGYNMTAGGEGRIKYNYQELADMYLSLGSEKAVCDYFNCSPSTVKKACAAYDISVAGAGSLTKKQWDCGERENVREQMRQLGKNNKGKVLSQEHKQKLSEAKLGKYAGENSPMFGKHLSQEHKNKLSENSAWAKAVQCIETGSIYHSACKAAEAVGLKNSAGISKCCAGQRQTAGGYHWQYCLE